MKKVIISLSFFLFIGISVFAQMGINNDNSLPDPSAGLDVKFINKGFLPPRMTFVQRNAIISPAAGLMVWCSNCGASGELEVFNGTSWTNMTGGAVSFAIGQSYGGGIIFYLDGTGLHGLISAPTDQSTGAQWGCYGTSIGGTGTAIGTGQDNTTLIVNVCSESGTAARICDVLVLNGYSDWFLPSKDELNQMYLQKTVIGGFADWYWSSSEYNVIFAWDQNFSNGLQGYYIKNATATYVRAVRAF